MKRLLRIARTELLEQRRQPWMIFVLAVNYLVVNVFFGIGMLAITFLAGSEQGSGQLTTLLSAFNVQLEPFLNAAITGISTLNFGTLLVYVSITTGTVVLHDRQNGVMPFLMLAPVTRFQILAGKLIGAMAIPLLVYVGCIVVTVLPLGHLDALAPFASQLGGSVAWWMSFLLAAPAAALFSGAISTVVSALSRDMRTAMQFTSALVSILGAAVGYLLVDAIKRGPALPIAWAGGFVASALLVLAIGASLISTDAAAQ